MVLLNRYVYLMIEGMKEFVGNIYIALGTNIFIEDTYRPDEIADPDNGLILPMTELRKSSPLILLFFATSCSFLSGSPQDIRL